MLQQLVAVVHHFQFSVYPQTVTVKLKTDTLLVFLLKHDVFLYKPLQQVNKIYLYQIITLYFIH